MFSPLILFLKCANILTIMDLEHPHIAKEQEPKIEVEPTTEPLTLEQRQYAYIVDNFTNHHGELLPDHPAQQLANRCLEQVQPAFDLGGGGG